MFRLLRDAFSCLFSLILISSAAFGAPWPQAPATPVPPPAGATTKPSGGTGPSTGTASASLLAGLVKEAAPSEIEGGRAEIGPHYGVSTTDRWSVFGDTSLRARTVAAGVLELAHRDLRTRFFRTNPAGGAVVFAENAASAPLIATFADLDERAAAVDRTIPAPVILRKRGRPIGVPDEFRLAEFAARRFLDAELPRASPWVREAIASAFAPATIDEHGKIVIGEPDFWALPADALGLHRTGFLKGKTLEAAYDGLSERARFRGVKFAAELCRMLLRSGDAKLAGLIARLRDGATFDAAFRAAAAMTPDALQAAIADHFENHVSPAIDLRDLKTERQFATFVKHHPEFGRARFLHGKSFGTDEPPEEAFTALRSALADRRFTLRLEAFNAIGAAAFSSDQAAAVRAYAVARRLQDVRFDIDVAALEAHATLVRATGEKDAARRMTAELAAMVAADKR